MTVLNRETGEITEPLTAMERSALVHEEAAIEQGADQVAKALGAIRDQRLYREGYATFEAYCRERWGMKRDKAYRLIETEQVRQIVSEISDTVNEAQARELADLRDRPDELRDTYRQAREATGGNVTAAAIREVRNPTPGSDHGADSEQAGEAGEPAESAPTSDDPASPEPRVTGIDGKSYPKPKSKPRRKPLPDAMWSATYELQKVTERLERLQQDDRFERNKEEVAARNRSYLIQSRERLDALIEALPD